MSLDKITAERRDLRNNGVNMRTREQWGAASRYLDDRAVVMPAHGFFLHVAVVNDPSDVRGAEDDVARTIERIGFSRFPNTGISYNALAFNTGVLYEGQPLTRRGAHTVNDKGLIQCTTSGCPNMGKNFPRGGEDGMNLNYVARALCLPQMPTDRVTDAQVRLAAEWSAGQVKAGMATLSARWHGHRCVAFKDCPGDPGFRRLDEIQQLHDQLLKPALPLEPLGEDCTMKHSFLYLVSGGDFMPGEAITWETESVDEGNFHDGAEAAVIAPYNCIGTWSVEVKPVDAAIKLVKYDAENNKVGEVGEAFGLVTKVEDLPKGYRLRAVVTEGTVESARFKADIRER